VAQGFLSFIGSYSDSVCLGSNPSSPASYPVEIIAHPAFSLFSSAALIGTKRVQKAAIGGKSVGESIGKTIGAFAPVLPLNPAISRSLTPGKEHAHAP
jgi:hypothetical protein